ncbi:DUF2634 domain-containing protein [Yanshouia hominis]|uniref:DUF2634 domain-containing protein n=1 Tax=Yanshouia hominis TaxID=2763673 RepID=A0ABR7NPP5_9FIRM|nr:DUF2634 domain-containing protein [Yanshouia hominis]MBC8577812.1 DUF2634 domain-containing protein [Yanshouia hominis]
MSVLKTYGSDTASRKPSKTYRIVGDRIEGFCDGKQAVMQAIDLMLNTERWRHLIYSGDYGVELEELLGQSRGYLEADMERRFSEALAEDDRITGIRDFAMSFEGDRAVISFIAETVFGDAAIERGVEIG